MRLKIISSFLFFMYWIPSNVVFAQSNLRIYDCYKKAKQSYPLIRQKQLISKSNEYTIANAQSARLPQFTISAQATYQSDVTQIPFQLPGIDIKPMAKDQYKITAEANQMIYDGGVVKTQVKIQETSAQIDQQKLEIDLYQVNDRINQLFFGVLLMDAQLQQIELFKKDIRTSLAKIESAIRHGVAFQSNADVLQAELLKAEQRTIEMNTTRSAYIDMLGYFIHEPLMENIQLERPVSLLPLGETTIRRPELIVYQFQNDLLAAQYRATTLRTTPKLGAFIQGGYGRPALNVLKNEFDLFYIGGLRLNWSLSGFYNSKRNKQLLEINTQSVNTQKETFLFNTELSIRQQNKEVQKLQALLQIDDQIVLLRSKIKNTAQSQHDHGIISTNDLLREINAEDAAKQIRLLHEIQLLLAQYHLQTTIGN